MDIEEAHTPHKAHTGHRWVDIMLGLAAIVVSGISLSVAVHHGHTMEKLVEANSFPNLEMSQTIADGESFSVAIENSGVGPGRVESLELRLGGKAVTTPRELVNALASAHGGSIGGVRIESGNIVGRLVGANRSEEFFKISAAQPDPTAPLQTLKAYGGMDTRLCYCSVFDECYVADSRVERGRPKHVERCVAVASGYHEDLEDTVPTP